MHTDPAVISLATAAFEPSLRRLDRSLDHVGFGGLRRFWEAGAFPDGCPDQLDVPFAFKPHCFAAAGASGLRNVLWLDATCVAIRPLDAVFDLIASRGHALFLHRKYKLGEWASDAALAAFGLDRETAMRLPEVNASAIGLDLDHPVAAEFLARWRRAADEGTAFRGVEKPIRSADDYQVVKWNRSGRCSADPRVRGHRHDQTAAGIVAHQLGMELSTSGLQPYRRWRRPIRPTTALINCPRPGRFDDATVAVGLAVGWTLEKLRAPLGRESIERGRP
jgi:hypothetical protein